MDLRSIDPNLIAARVLQATAHDEAIRTLAQARSFDGYQDDGQYVVTVNGATARDPMLARAILLAAKQAGLAVPAIPTITEGT